MYPADLIEEQVSSTGEAQQLLEEGLPAGLEFFESWLQWAQEKIPDSALLRTTKNIVLVSYARMALRNGSLSINPRSYHSEEHIEDLFTRVKMVSGLKQSESIPGYGWSLLSLFICCHDLRQSEKNNPQTLVGNNEQASFDELVRLLNKYDKHHLFDNKLRNILKVMIHGSTFGSGEDTNGNIYRGNLVKYLLDESSEFDDMDRELAYIACDIDTANVAIDFKEFAQSSINVYDEIQNISPQRLTAKEFFGEQQESYFFDLQKFDSRLCNLAFSRYKEKNAPMVSKVSQSIRQLDTSYSDEQVVKYYIDLVESVSQ